MGESRWVLTLRGEAVARTSWSWGDKPWKCLLEVSKRHFMKTISAKFPSPTEALNTCKEEKLGQDPSAQGRSLGLWQRLADRLTGWDQVNLKKAWASRPPGAYLAGGHRCHWDAGKGWRRTEFSLWGNVYMRTFHPSQGVADPLRTLLDLHLELTFDLQRQGYT